MEDESDMSFSHCLPALPKEENTPKPKKRKEKRLSDIKLDKPTGDDEPVTKVDTAALAKKVRDWQKNTVMGSCLDGSTLEHLGVAEKTLSEESWLAVSKTGLLCIPCNRASLNGAWSDGTAGSDVKDLRLWFVTKHAKSKSHVQAVKQMLKVNAGPAGAPALSEFEDVLDQLQSGSSLRGTSKSSFSDKVALIAWSLQEAALCEILAWSFSVFA